MTPIADSLEALFTKGSTAFAREKAEHVVKVRQLERDLADRDRYKAALELIWNLHVRQQVHLGYERWSGFEQGCIACVCALVLGQTSYASPTTEELIERKNRLKAGDQDEVLK